ncbi:hypothetical protein OPT61_g2480 [Boeremia exigua]|uniref:Uncharacterized protein n=1 Tax=Boeremia exigua TaxID=749465 RepID=A0ACC2ILJ9_9PLEO|nr:hypothetical protein OPT61_g2480 [Boeremia exigua]
MSRKVAASGADNESPWALEISYGAHRFQGRPRLRRCIPSQVHSPIARLHKSRCAQQKCSLSVQYHTAGVATCRELQQQMHFVTGLKQPELSIISFRGCFTLFGRKSQGLAPAGLTLADTHNMAKSGALRLDGIACELPRNVDLQGGKGPSTAFRGAAAYTPGLHIAVIGSGAVNVPCSLQVFAEAGDLVPIPVVRHGHCAALGYRIALLAALSSKMVDRRAISGANFTTQRHPTTYDHISPLKLDLTGKHVLVTGAAYEDGVGYATATAFARAGAAAIAMADLHGVSDDLAARLKSAATQAGRAEPKVVCCKVDISQLDSVRALFDVITEAFGGRLDVVVNNAAHMEPYLPLLETDPDVYWRTYEVNVRGLFNMARTFLPMLLSSRASYEGLCTMVNVASSGALTARPGSGSYRSSKLAVVRWTETLQLEYEDQGLLTFCVNPGAIKTKITETSPEAVRNAFPNRPEIAGDTIVWLAAERREWLGGRYMDCPWDMEEVMAKKDEIINGDKLKMRMAF